jgi:O-antigen/teichoic acid export membrane protein
MHETNPSVELSRRSAPSLVRNVISNWGSYFCNALLGFFIAPFIVKHLGMSGYGVWSLVVSLTGYLGLLDLGVRGAVTRYVAKFHTRQEYDNMTRTVSAALLIFLLAGTVAIVVSASMLKPVISHFKIPREYERAAEIVVLLAGVNVAVSLVSGVFGGVVIGLQRFDISNVIEILTTLLRTAAIVFALKRGGGIVALAWIQLLFALALGIANAWAAWNYCPQLRLRLNGVRYDHLKLIISFSAFSFLLQSSSYMIYYTDSVVIGAFLPIGAVTLFAIAGNLMNYARGLIAGISSTITPFASSVEAKSGYAELRPFLLKAPRYASTLMLPIAVTFLIRGKSFIALWMGAEYASVSSIVLSILTIAWLLMAGNRIAGAVMLGISKHRAMVPVSIAEAFCNLGLSLLLVRKVGVIGVAWGTTIPNVAVHLLFWPWYVRRILGIPPWRYICSTWVRPAASVLPFALVTYATERLWPAVNLRLFFFQVLCLLPFAVIGAWIVVMSAEERSTILRQHGLRTSQP